MKLHSVVSVVLLLFLQQRPQSSIEGTITQLGGGSLPGARVTLTRLQQIPPNAIPASGLSAGVLATTDDKGRFLFQNVEEGTYTIQIQANGFVTQSYGQRSANRQGTAIPLAANQAVKDINVVMTPAGTISGRVRDSSDQPLVNVPVQLIRSSYDFQGQRTFQSVATTQTDDRGEYRMYWVTPGRYYLVAGRPSSGGNGLEALIAASRIGPNGNEVPTVYSYAFYPGVSDLSSARVIDLLPAADLQAIDVTLTAKPRTFTVRGKLIDSRTGQSPPRATVIISTQTPGLNTGGSQIILGPIATNRNYDPATGRIELKDLMQGSYTIMATVLDPAVPGRSGPAVQSSAIVPVAISDADIDGLVISVVPATTILGRMRIDGQLDASASLDRMRVALTPIGVTTDALRSLQSQLSGGYVGPAANNVNADGTFRLTNVTTGDYRLEVTATPQRLFVVNGFIREARFEGTDVLSTPLRVSGTASGSLEIVVSAGGGKLTGTISDSRFQPVPGTQVVLIPDRARFRTDLFRTTTANQSGQFTLSAISPGDYKLFAWEKIEDNSWFDPDVIARYETRGRAVHVSESSSETVDIRIIAVEGPR